MASDPIVVVVRRNGVTEALHRVHAVAVQDGAVVEEAGDPALVAYLRSSAKPLQALPLARARPDVSPRELAIACASHLADADQLSAVRSLLARAPAGEAELECGPDGDPPGRIKHNCSGKHAGMLALSRASGWPSSGYRLAQHPANRVAVIPHERRDLAVAPALLFQVVDYAAVHILQHPSASPPDEPRPAVCNNGTRGCLRSTWSTS